MTKCFNPPHSFFIFEISMKKEFYVAIGSTNPAKINGVKRAFENYYEHVYIKHHHVDNLVGPQPIGYDQILNGSLNRALEIKKIYPDSDFYVGVEAGLVEHMDRYFALQVSTVISKSGKISYGISPAFEVPTEIALQVIEGKVVELEDAVLKYYGVKNIGEKEGLIGLLSRGKVTREDLSFIATLMALINFGIV